MILIINQHKGDFSELRDHMINYLEVSMESSVFMILRVDQEISEAELEWLITLQKENEDKFTFLYSGINIGLSPSRHQCLLHSKNYSSEKYFTHVIFGCTNSKWDTLNGIEEVLQGYNSVTLIPCKYKGSELFDRSPLVTNQIHGHKAVISFNEYFNNEYRPDYTLVFPYEDCMRHLNQVSIEGEKYRPEDSLIYLVCKDHNYKLEIHPCLTMTAWYNSNGLSSTFSRKSVIDNKQGFYHRSTLLLSEYLNGNLSLSYSRLRGLLNDFVTLGPSVDLTKFKGTILEPLINWNLTRWINTSSKNHKLKFIEDA